MCSPDNNDIQTIDNRQDINNNNKNKEKTRLCDCYMLR